ncbi:helix-turn-helix transcriptional regulator [Ferrimonas sp. SCSIO 43195]|uniref:LuxR family transcriptional regulator n=1 Tax=Ferrimonas sp. SCSIO 43195 TaxID=2822844 RepID=UPI002076357C|nr:helix-turn-helix transcriptional regulator [Ferrimonas sp. SCSIO 43195]USD36167.1 helix-turn-helix transcriptional regulator [Ferrimonas sp. SCSIO 43195]
MDWLKLYPWINDLSHCQGPAHLRALLNRLLPIVGADACLLMLIDLRRGVQHTFCAGLSARSQAFVAGNTEQDRYLHTYMSNKLVGESVCLQELLPRPKAEAGGFLERYQPYFDYRFSYGLVLPLNAHQQVAISLHRHRTPFQKLYQHDMNGLGAAILPWAHHYLKLRSHSPLAELCLEPLTPAERQVLNLLMEGLDGSEIADYRGVSKETVKSQLKSLLHKTDSRHQNQLLHRAYTLTPRFD